MIGNIYRPPRSLNENYNEFINEFSNAISSLKNNHKQNLILAGDFNINMLKINEQENCSSFFDMLTSFSLFPQITCPTKKTREATKTIHRQHQTVNTINDITVRTGCRRSQPLETGRQSSDGG